MNILRGLSRSNLVGKESTSAKGIGQRLIKLLQVIVNLARNKSSQFPVVKLVILHQNIYH